MAGARALTGTISLVHGPGSVLWITGENGAGKSSLLRAIARHTRHRGAVRLTASGGVRAISYYAPTMHFSSGVRVEDWLALHRRLHPGADHAQRVDAILPAGAQGLATRLSTGEAKRLQLWSLLRVAPQFYVLDEPFEHLSPTAKLTLTAILGELASFAAVIVATNQEVPANVPARLLELD